MLSESDTTPLCSFADLGLPPALLRSLDDAGYQQPTSIQAEMIPLMMDGKDVIGQAQTGTGKTAAFALPLLAKLSSNNLKSPQILVLTPTRELAIQVQNHLKATANTLRTSKCCQSLEVRTTPSSLKR